MANLRSKRHEPWVVAAVAAILDDDVENAMSCAERVSGIMAAGIGLCFH